MFSQPVTRISRVRIYLPIRDLLFKLAVRVVIPYATEVSISSFCFSQHLLKTVLFSVHLLSALCNLL